MRHEHQKIAKNKETGRVRVQTINSEKTQTQQQFAQECDINFIMDKYIKTGEFTHATQKKGTYGDFSEISDYHSMLNTVIYAQEAFALLPATIRARFRNDPGELLNFINDDSNYDEALKLGLLNPDLPPKTMAQNNAIQRDEKTPKKNDKSKIITESITEE